MSYFLAFLLINDCLLFRTLGVLHQLSYLSCFATETFNALTVLAEDMNDRIFTASTRTHSLFSKLAAVDRKVQTSSVTEDIHSIREHHAALKNRDMTTPSLFHKSTNYSSIAVQYRYCRPPPQFWRIEAYLSDSHDCYQYFSNPGFFFQVWLQSEIMRQQRLKEENRKAKDLRKQLKNERRRERRARALLPPSRKSLMPRRGDTDEEDQNLPPESQHEYKRESEGVTPSTNDSEHKSPEVKFSNSVNIPDVLTNFDCIDWTTGRRES